MSEAKERGPKRGNGEGSISQLPSGLWRGRIMVGVRSDGRPDWRTHTAKGRKAVQAWLADTKRRADGGLLGDREKQRGTLSAYLDGWQAAIRASVRPGTSKRYEILLRVHVRPTIGHKRLEDIRPDTLRALYADRLEHGLSPTTVRLIHTVIRKALSDAVESGYLGSNPAARARPPRRADFEAVPPTAEEVARLLDVADVAGDRLAGLWALLAQSGARIGELLGLGWEDVSWDRAAITIRRSLDVESGPEPTYGMAKTARGRRVVSLGAEALEALRGHRARQAAERLRRGEAYRDFGLVFATASGTSLGERNVIRAFKAALRRAELRDDIRIHDIRHYHITAAAHAGVSVKALSTRVGHASVAFTLDRYAHALEGGDRDVADAVERAIRGGRQQAEHSRTAASDG